MRKGDKCTYAHSEAERDAWNREKFGPGHRQKPRTQGHGSRGISQPSRGRHASGELPRLEAAHNVSPGSHSHGVRSQRATWGTVLKAGTKSQDHAQEPTVRTSEVSGEEKVFVQAAQPPPPPVPDESTVARRTATIINELCMNNDFEEATECVKEIISPTMMHVFVRELINHTLEKSKHSRLTAGKLMKHLLLEKLLARDDICAGLAEVLEFAEDLEMDIPQFWDCMAQIVSQPLSEPTLLPLSSITSAMPSSLAEKGKVGSFVAKVMAQLKDDCTESVVASLWFSSGLKWQKLGVKDEDVRIFQELDLLVQSRLSIDSARPPSQSLPDLIFLFKSPDNTNDDIMDWIDKNCACECHTPTFIRTLSTALLQAFVSGHGTAALFKGEEFNRRVVVLKRYVDNKTELQLEVLYAFQIAVAKMEHPPKLLNGLFNAVYDLELVDESTFYEWKESGKEPFGKGTAVHSLKSFFDWLAAADLESDSDT